MRKKRLAFLISYKMNYLMHCNYSDWRTEFWNSLSPFLGHSNYL